MLLPLILMAYRMDRTSLFSPPARGCYAVPTNSYLVLVDTEEELQKFVRFAGRWTSQTIVAYDSEGSSSYPQTLQFATGPWEEAHSIVVDVPACRKFPSFDNMIQVLRQTEARFFGKLPYRSKTPLFLFLRSVFILL